MEIMSYRVLYRFRTVAYPDLSSGLMAGAGRRLAPFVAAILASGYDGGPAGGPVPGVPQAPGLSFLGCRDGFGLVRGLAGAR